MADPAGADAGGGGGTRVRVARRGSHWRVEVERETDGDDDDVVDPAERRDFRDLGSAERHAAALADARRPCELLVSGPRGELLHRRVYAPQARTS